MTGGIAFVLDEWGEFANNLCNQSSVDLEPIIDAADTLALRNLIATHVEATGSPRGQWILENWLTMLPKFVKVFPHEFKRVLGIPRGTRPLPAQFAQPVSAPASERQQVAHG
jgi:glutamate synthase domain-containing protein 3